MIRTQVQLTEEQLAALKGLAAASGRSLADLVREGVDLLLGSGGEAARAERQERALGAVGRFASGCSDVSNEHDRHLAEAFGE
jgi:Ribbon-helix-helix protein, copG family